MYVQLSRTFAISAMISFTRVENTPMICRWLRSWHCSIVSQALSGNQTKHSQPVLTHALSQQGQRRGKGGWGGETFTRISNHTNLQLYVACGACVATTHIFNLHTPTHAHTPLHTARVTTCICSFHKYNLAPSLRHRSFLDFKKWCSYIEKINT